VTKTRSMRRCPSPRIVLQLERQVSGKESGLLKFRFESIGLAQLIPPVPVPALGTFLTVTAGSFVPIAGTHAGLVYSRIRPTADAGI